MMHIMELTDLRTLTVVGLPVRANWTQLWTEMPKAWRRFIDTYSQIEKRVDDTFVDVSLEKIGDDYCQLICARVEHVGHVPFEMWAISIPAQTYIHHRHVGPTKAIANTFAKMHEWADRVGQPISDLKVDIGYTVAGNEDVHDLYVGLLPVKPWIRLPSL